MTELEFQDLFTNHPHLEMIADDKGAWFRWNGLPFYDNNPDVGFYMSGERIGELSPDELVAEVKKGFELDHITRITGYMTRVESWNKGKVGELRDRYKNDGFFGGETESPLPPPRPWGMAKNQEFTG